MPKMKSRNANMALFPLDQSFKSWIWDVACSICGAKAVQKYKDYILPLTTDYPYLIPAIRSQRHFEQIHHAHQISGPT